MVLTCPLAQNEIQGCGWGMVNGTNTEFQLSDLFADPNAEIFGVGQRGSDNRGWTVAILSKDKLTDIIVPNINTSNILSPTAIVPSLSVALPGAM